MEIQYFISYVVAGKDGIRLGNCFVKRDRLIKTAKDISDIEDKIRDKNNVEDAIILNYKRMGAQ